MIRFSHDRCLVIAEIAQAHDGSLGTAHAYIDAVAASGADAIKFQTHIAAAESSPAEPWRVKFSRQDATRYEYWKRMEFTPEQWKGLAEHCRDKGLLFLSSPFSIEAAELLLAAGVTGWKIASGEVSNAPMLRFLASTGLPFLISSGMSAWEELDRAIAAVRGAGTEICLFQCTTAYPCPAEKIGFNLIGEMKARYPQCYVGLSDHSGTIYPGLAAATVGVAALEVHVTFSRECFGPDVPASLTTGELRQLMEGIRFIETMKANPVSKDAIAVEMEGNRRLFTKSVAVRVGLDAGAALDWAHLTVKKPGTGIPAERLESLIGRRLSRRVEAGQFLAMEDLAEGHEQGDAVSAA
ncbi:MAG: N-acetylneuraminate synthase family protein [Bryobacteraceae bacterium]